MRLEDLCLISYVRSVEFVIAWLFERTAVIHIDWSIIGATYKILIIMTFSFVLILVSLLLVFLVLIHFIVSLLFDLINVGIFPGTRVLVDLSFAARNHNEAQSIHLSCVIRSLSFYYGTLFEIPDDDSTVLGARGNVAIAVANLDINDHFQVTMETCLKYHGILPPDFDDSKVKNTN